METQEARCFVQLAASTTCSCPWPRHEGKQVETSFSSGSSRRPSHTRTLSLRGCSSKYSHRLCKEVAALITSSSALGEHSQPQERKWRNEPLQFGGLLTKRRLTARQGCVGASWGQLRPDTATPAGFPSEPREQSGPSALDQLRVSLLALRAGQRDWGVGREGGPSLWNQAEAS